VVVDDDVDVFNEEEVIWAVLTRTNPKRDVEFLKNVGYTVFATEFSNNKVVIDATKPLDKPFPVKFRVPPRVLDAVRPEEWID
jgi:3-polyprenyl-4-hydroxybenzoate decarboxylase